MFSLFQTSQVFFYKSIGKIGESRELVTVGKPGSPQARREQRATHGGFLPLQKRTTGNRPKPPLDPNVGPKMDVVSRRAHCLNKVVPKRAHICRINGPRLVSLAARVNVEKYRTDRRPFSECLLSSAQSFRKLARHQHRFVGIPCHLRTTNFRYCVFKELN